MTPAPELSALTLPELRALHQALGMAIAAAKAGGAISTAPYWPMPRACP